MTGFRRGHRPADLTQFAFPRPPGANLGAAARPRPKPRIADAPLGRVIAGLVIFASVLTLLLVVTAALD